MSSILLKNISLNDSQSDIYINGGLIEKICACGEDIAYAEGTEIVDCKDKVAIPGFINMHTHAAMSMMRGLGEDAPLDKWLNNIWEIEAKVGPEYIYWASKVACLEMIKTGTTTFNDHYWMLPQTRKAASELGIRPVLSHVTLDAGDKEKAERYKRNCTELYEHWNDIDDIAKFVISIHSVYTVSEEMIVWMTEFANERNLRIHIHVSETLKEVDDCKALHNGLSPVEYLDKLGVLSDKTTAAHTLWLSDNDIKILGDRKVNCVHNINSNTKLASGYRFRYNELKEAGANVCLGTDGCASSNNLDMLETMKTSALFQKAWREDPTSWPLNELLDCATINGAKALGLNTGSIEEGKAADILIIDTNSSFFLSKGDFLANLIYSAHSDCIESVIVDGKFVMRNRIVEGEKEILDNARNLLNNTDYGSKIRKNL